MIRFSKLRSLNLSSYCKFVRFHALRFQNLHLSSNLCDNQLTNHSISKKAQENRLLEQARTKSTNSLFSEITEILGADSLAIDRTWSGNLISGETLEANTGVRGEREEGLTCAPGVCENANQNREQEMGNVVETDVSPVVNRVAEIVRDENGVVSMEERLENSGIMFDPEIVEKVLKRCFKVPRLGLRFFSWLKNRNEFGHTTGTYNTMMFIAEEAREFGLVDELLEEMEKHSCERDIKTWTILISRYAKSKSIGKALLSFEMMRKSGHDPDVAAYKVMIHSLCTNGKTEIAMEMYKEMAHKGMGVLNLSSYKMLLNCLASSGDTAAFHLIADDMLSVFPERDVYDCMLKGFCISGRINEALELIRDFINKNFILDGEHFRTLVKGLCRAGRIADALEIINVMKRKHIVDGKAYGIIISAYLKRDDISTALDLFHSTIESGLLPPTSIYTELIQHFFRTNEYQKGCKLYEEMLGRGIKPDSVAVMALFSGHVRHNRISEAWKVFESMEEKGIRITRKSCIVFIKELCKMSRTDEIIRVLKRMQASKISIGDEEFNWVFSYLERKGDMENTEKVAHIHRNCKAYPHGNEVFISDVYKEHEPENVNNPNMGNTLPKAYTDHDLEQVCRILSSSCNWFSTLEALEKCAVQFTPALVVEILRHCSIHGSAALQFFSWVGKLDGYSHTTETYNMAIKVSGRGKDFKHMRTLFFEMRRKGNLITSDTWTIMIMQYGRTGLTDIALRTFREMKANHCKPTCSTYKYLIICLCEKKGRNVNSAIETLEEMIHAGYIPDKELLESYFDCLCESDKLIDARRCADSLHGVGFSVPLSYSLYIRALIQAGKLTEALSMIDEVDSERSTLDEYVYASIVHGLLQASRLEEAYAKIDAMNRVGIHPTVHIYTSLIDFFFREQQTDRALEILKKMRAEGCEPTIVTYSSLIRGYMNNGKVTEAWDVFNQIKREGPHPDFKTYSFFIACLCRVGKSEEALQLLSEMLDSGMVPSCRNFQTVIYGLNREGKQYLAQTVLQKKLALTRRRKFLA